MQLRLKRDVESCTKDYFEKYTDTWKLNRDCSHVLSLDPDPTARVVNCQEFMTVLSMLFFKWAFAAPNTYKALKLSQLKGELPENFDPKLPGSGLKFYGCDVAGTVLI